MTLKDRLLTLVNTPAGAAVLRRMVTTAEASVRLTTRRGKAKGGGQSSKAKGRQAVVALRDKLTGILGIPAEGMMVKATSMPGVDLYIAPEHRHRFPFSIECKCVEAFSPWAAYAQAQENTDHGDPIVFFKRAKTPMFVMVTADRFLAMQAALNKFAESGYLNPHP